MLVRHCQYGKHLEDEVDKGARGAGVHVVRAGARPPARRIQERQRLRRPQTEGTLAVHGVNPYKRSEKGSET